ncbi:MAG: radical SAM protein [Pseudomonadota bacterium]
MEEVESKATRIEVAKKNSLNEEGYTLPPFRSLSVMVNSTCNLRCKHCDLPRFFDRYSGTLGTEEWGDLIDKLIKEYSPVAVSVSAMEPLLPDGSREKTVQILKVAKRNGLRAGLVTNGMYAGEFLSAWHAKSSPLDFLDISIDGPPEVDKRIRGTKHLAAIEAFLKSGVSSEAVERVYISTALSQWNCSFKAITRHIDWVSELTDNPRIVFLAIHPNEHVDKRLPLPGKRFEETISSLAKGSRRCEEMFLDVFPSSLPDLAHLIENEILPGRGAVAEDDTGMLWGHVSDNLFVRYNNNQLLSRYQLRISPEGFALLPDAIEYSGYLSHSFGNLLLETPRAILANLARRLNSEQESMPSYCRGRDCEIVCRSENRRCSAMGCFAS